MLSNALRKLYDVDLFSLLVVWLTLSGLATANNVVYPSISLPICNTVYVQPVGTTAQFPNQYGIVEWRLRDGGVQCSSTIILQASLGRGINVRFEKLMLDCSRGARVTIAETFQSNSYCGWYNDYPVKTSSSNYLNITYFSGTRTPTTSSEAVVFYYTAADDCSLTDVNVTKFKCDNGRCIPRAVACDDRDNCGDWSDESSTTCDKPTTTTTGNVVAFSACITLAITGLFCTLWVCLKRKHQKNRSEASQNHDNNTNQNHDNHSSNRSQTNYDGNHDVVSAVGGDQGPDYSDDDRRRRFSRRRRRSCSQPHDIARIDVYNEENAQDFIPMPPAYDSIDHGSAAPHGDAISPPTYDDIATSNNDYSYIPDSGPDCSVDD